MLSFIDAVNKVGKKIDIHKTGVYKDIVKNKIVFKNKGLDICIRNEFDLFQYDLMLNSLLNFVYIENNIEIFLNMNLDILNIVNYVEKQRLFDHDASIFLKDIKYFVDEKSGVKIYIPIFDDLINYKYIHEYQAILLKKYRVIVNDCHLSLDTPVKLYGLNVYRSDFSSLQIVYEDFRHICMYFDDLKTIYIFDKKKCILLNKMIICDDDCSKDIDLNVVKDIAQCLEDYRYNDCLDLMYNHQYVNILSYNSINSRLK